MSHKTSLRVWEHSATRGAMRCLMLALADFANDDGICWPGTAVLAEKVNESKDYTDTLIKKCIEVDELDKNAGRGRGHTTRFAILCGLDSKAQERLKGILQKGYSSAPIANEKGHASTPIAKRGTTKGVLWSAKRGTFPDTNDHTNGASEPSETAIDEKQIHHDPTHGVGDGDGRTLAFLIDRGVSAAQEFARFDYETTVIDYDARAAAGHTNAQIVRAWRSKQPTKGDTYADRKPQRPLQPDVSPGRPQRPTGRHNGTGGADLKDPGWQQREIARIQREYGIPDSEL